MPPKKRACLEISATSYKAIFYRHVKINTFSFPKLGVPPHPYTNVTVSYRQPKLDHFTKKRRSQRCFVSFYRQPSFRTWAMFFNEDPLWALETLASYLVNYFKFSRAGESFRGPV